MNLLKELLCRVTVTGTNLDSLEIPCGTLRVHSLACRPGDAFIALKGPRFDGHDFICTAVEHGAALIVHKQFVKLRKKLGFSCIETVYRQGYKLRAQEVY